LPDFMLTDPDRADYDELPILTADGYSYANRFGIPSADMSVVTLHQSRAWYAVDSTGAKPNSVYFSSIDEFESVSADNELVVENVGREADVITGLMPMDGVLYVGKQRSLVRVTSGDEPLLDAAAVPAAQRGMLNDRCWDQFDGVAYIADSAGVYSFTGSASESLSDAISTYWTDPVIDFSKSKWFFVRVNAKERVARFYFTKTSHQYPQSALCYSLITKAWWLEEYAVPVSCGVRAVRSGQQAELLGGTGRMLTPGGTTDNGTAIPYSLKTGNFPLNDDPKRAVRVTYSPTASSHAVGIRMYYNNSSAPRANAIASDRGTGIVTTTGSTEATLDLSASRSPLGEANGFAQASFSGRLDDRSAGSDRHLAVELAGTQDAVTPVIHRLDLEGVG
jgi:hypothetical protein